MSPLYVYAVVDELPGEGGVGLLGEPLRAVRCGPVVAAVGEVPEAPPVEEPTLRGHDATVRRLAELTRALLPVRFGSLAADEEELERMLAPRGEELRQALAAVAGRIQMTIRIHGDVAAAPEPVDGGAAAAGPGSRYLEQRRRAQSIPGLAALREALGPLVAAERIEPHHTPPLLASVYHLVDRGMTEAYVAAVAALPAGPLHLRVVGPAPPYAFVPDGIGGSGMKLETKHLDAMREELRRRTTEATARWNADPEEVQRSVAKLVLTLVDFLRKLLEKQAIRRMDAGTLTPEETEAIGLALMRLEETVHDLARRFGLSPDELHLDLGPLGRLG